MRTIITLLLLLVLYSTNSYSFSGNGSGTEEDPYQISNVHQLQEMNDDLSAHYILINDIDASETRDWNVGDHDYDPETPDSAMGFEPVGTFEDGIPQTGFTGSLDGQDYVITDLFIYRPTEDNVGLMGCLSDGGILKYLNLNNSEVTGKDYVGIIVGNCYSFAKDMEVNTMHCSTSGKVSGNFFVGGFCGANRTSLYGKASLYDCSASGNVSGNVSVGGFCGFTADSINECYSNVEVSGKDYIGGFCGQNYANGGLKSSINDCYAIGNVVGNFYAGGFCGYNTGYIINCHASGSVTGNNYIGGFCGWNYALSTSEALIKNCHSKGSATGKEYVGGFCGYSYAAILGYDGTSAMIITCYSEGNADGISYVGGFCGSNKAYGSVSDIHNCHSFGHASGSGDFIGGFCGENKNTNWHMGSNLFRSGRASISYCLSTGNAMGSDYIGGFCGQSNGLNISGSCAKGNASGNDYVGGFCGMNNTKARIVDSYTMGNSSGNTFIGGFCGQNINSSMEIKTSSIERCYSIGVPQGDSCVGGFCGFVKLYGIAERIIDSYWDTQTSEIDSSDGGEGKTTAEMMMKSTFENWDFDNVWCIGNRETYPQLQHFVDCDTLVSVPDIENEEGIKIYPNPAVDMVTVSSKFLIGKEIHIYNLLGILVWQDIATDYNFDIDISSLTRNVYILRIEEETLMFVKN